MSDATPVNYPTISGWTPATDGTLVCFKWVDGRLVECDRAANYKEVAQKNAAWRKAQGR